MAITKYYTVDGEIIGEATGGIYRPYGADALGSVVATYDSVGAVENTYRNAPYGTQTAKMGPAADPRFLWNGNSGYRNSPGFPFSQFYVRSRHFAAGLAQWTGRDPYWPTEREYSYVLGRPADMADPTGYSCGKYTWSYGPLICDAHSRTGKYVGKRTFPGNGSAYYQDFCKDQQVGEKIGWINYRGSGDVEWDVGWEAPSWDWGDVKITCSAAWYDWLEICAPREAIALTPGANRFYDWAIATGFLPLMDIQSALDQSTPGIDYFCSTTVQMHIDVFQSVATWIVQGLSKLGK